MAAPRASAPRLGAAERHEQLADVAARRFHEFGYHGVSLGGVAAEAGVTGPAVYRYFRNKEALLAAAIDSGLTIVEQAVADGARGTLEDLVGAVAVAGLRRPDMWVLLQRESRFLSPALRDPVQQRFGGLVDAFSRRLRRDRTDLAPDHARLLVTAATSVLSTPSTSRTSLSPGRYRRELTATALAALHADPAAAPTRRGPPAADDEPTVGRREQVVATAAELFHRHSYHAVSLDDIGAAVGLAGPSILHHFPTKADILVAAFDRATARLEDLRTRRGDGDGPAGPDGLLAGYVDYALANRALLGVYVSDSRHVHADARARTTAVVRAELRAWRHALSSVEPGLSPHVAGVRVRAALGVVNDLVRLGHVAERARAAGEITAVAAAVLRSRLLLDPA